MIIKSKQFSIFDEVMVNGTERTDKQETHAYKTLQHAVE